MLPPPNEEKACIDRADSLLPPPPPPFDAPLGGYVIYSVIKQYVYVPTFRKQTTVDRENVVK